MSETLHIDCQTCCMRDTDACGDCLVTFIHSREPEEAVVITMDELRSMRLMAEAGLVPQLRHQTG